MDDIIINTQPYIDAIALVRNNPFDIQKVPLDIVDERLLRLARKGHGWSVEAWMASVPKSYKALAKNVFIDIGIVREYDDL